MLHAQGSKPAFKLAAYGVKQGGIGSLLAGGFPGLKKTAGPKKQSPPADHEKPVSNPFRCMFKKACMNNGSNG